MSCEIKRIEKYLALHAGYRATSPLHILLVSDSKGRYLQNLIKNLQFPTPNITFYFLGGRNSDSGLSFIRDNITVFQNKHPNLLILFWHGTCDITRKIGKHIFTKHNTVVDATDTFKSHFAELTSIANEHPSVKFGILEIPPISVLNWNKLKDYEHWEALDDHEVNCHTRAYNELVKSFNENFGFVSPRFELDFQKSRTKPKIPHPKMRYTLNFNLLSDGIHPQPLVAKYWLIKILQKCDQV